ncbi:hypothetical protein GYMLUDRAFT_251106 [Collybiopsis luxurians FD-317 M1]|uniref:Uncharacterized protein n=1 Tax=Collybiopsis luxurians FD-317 M1 TaxID=944289 RepID=A0A0D0AQK5_9AGAR|nr:hypothetical protein GYMLUDRAFT_251106 [Collybiopsis luxurians FD-317 M1]
MTSQDDSMAVDSSNEQSPNRNVIIIDNSGSSYPPSSSQSMSTNSAATVLELENPAGLSGDVQADLQRHVAEREAPPFWLSPAPAGRNIEVANEPHTPEDPPMDDVINYSLASGGEITLQVDAPALFVEGKQVLGLLVSLIVFASIVTGHFLWMTS